MNGSVSPGVNVDDPQTLGATDHRYGRTVPFNYTLSDRIGSIAERKHFGDRAWGGMRSH